MNDKKDISQTITGHLLQDVVARDKEHQAKLAALKNQQPQPADLAHDAGNGYNAGFVFPQK
jgi:hypothetical protein